ncbi:hypothetical protein GGR57DRAFT_520232 [Xylariaceae sp. FL1272]|nr:hypothetical protein GGR57DRAFT_520232 [Xylariaceae sp. FL1272]
MVTTTTTTNNYSLFCDESMSAVHKNMISHAWMHYRYALTQQECAEVLSETDMWESLDEYIEYCQEMNVYSKSARIYTTAELDAMDLGILPITYGLDSEEVIAEEVDVEVGVIEQDDTPLPSPLPLYDTTILPVYRSPCPSYRSPSLTSLLERVQFDAFSLASLRLSSSSSLRDNDSANDIESHLTFITAP